MRIEPAVAGRAPATRIPVLMYHSISPSPGPTSIPVGTFRGQIETLVACGYRTVSLGEFAQWHRGAALLPAKAVVLTFDDGFADFAESAFPILDVHNFSATVFLPSGRMGGVEDWVGADPSPRRLLDWSQVRDLAPEGVDFGGHSVTHADLTGLSSEALASEVRQCREDIAGQTGRVPSSFAPPYGRAGERERKVIEASFELSVGTRLARADRDSDRYDLPRIEMHYFRDLRRWRQFLEGRGESYFTARRTLRRVRQLVVG